MDIQIALARKISAENHNGIPDPFMNMSDDPNFYATLPGDHWVKAAKRICSKVDIVIFANPIDDDPKVIGLAFKTSGKNVVVVRSDLPVMAKVDMLVHEALHHKLHNVPEYVIVGKQTQRINGQNFLPRHEKETYQAGKQIMDKVVKRFEQLKQKAPRPAGYWEDSRTLPVSLRGKWVNDLLSCVY